MYHVLTILLHRPFVADGHLYNTSRSISVNSFITCASAADSIVSVLRTYDKVFSVRHAPYLISYATYVAATIHVRIAAKRRTESEARECLETCLSVFRDNRETNWAVRRAQAIVEGLMTRLGVSLTQDHDISQPRDRILHNTRRQVPEPAAQDYLDGPENLPPGTHGSSSQISLSSHIAPEDGSPSMGWSDIDGIIQSFVRGQDINTASAGPVQADRLQQQVPYDPEMHASNLGSSTFVGNQSWLQGMTGDNNSTSFEDLLFGFNGSALDSMFS